MSVWTGFVVECVVCRYVFLLKRTDSVGWHCRPYLIVIKELGVNVFYIVFVMLQGFFLF